MINIPAPLRKIYTEQGYVIIAQDPALDKLRAVEQQASGELLQGDLQSGESGNKQAYKKSESLKGGAPVSYDIPTIVNNLNWHMAGISDKVIGRDEIVRQAIFAILTGEHMLLLSRTGMAKSFLTNSIFNIFEGARVFATQASKDQTPDNYFGPYNIEEFKKGRIRHNIQGSIIEANFVFLDEFFDASDVVLRSLLSVLNERKFINGSEQIDVAIHTTIATANYMRMNEVTEAVLDRFSYKSVLPEDNNVYTQYMIDQSYIANRGVAPEPDRKIFFNQILHLHDIIRNNSKEKRIEIPEFIYFMKNTIVNKFVGEMRKSDYNYFISPRKLAKTADFLRASAIVAGRDAVTMDDLKELYLSLCTLNSFVSVKSKDKSEKDLFLDTCQQTLVHFNATGAIQQIEFLLNIRKIFQEIKENPEKRDMILQRKGFLETLFGFLKKLFPGKRTSDDETITVESLMSSVFDINPAVEEVRELKEGILRDYKGIY
jgi:MoxR-like ATPase